MAKTDLTAEQLRKLFNYNPKSGDWTYSVTCDTKAVEKTAGWIHPSGYRFLRINGYLYGAHRLVWLYVYGLWPFAQIDHRNGVRSDNRLENLRESTIAENAQNRGIKKNNTSGFNGVTWCKTRCKWVAQIKHNRQRRHLGYFDNPESAHAARLAAQKMLFQFQPVPRYIEVTVQK